MELRVEGLGSRFCKGSVELDAWGLDEDLFRVWEGLSPRRVQVVGFKRVLA